MRASRGISIHTGMAFLRNEFYNMSIYRVSFWINLFYTFLMMYSVGYVWRALYATNHNVSGVPLPQMISYAVLGVALEAILHPRNGPQIYIMEQVRKGTIEMDIMKPIDFQFYMFAKNMGSIAVRFVLGFTFIDCGIFPVFIKIAGFVCAFWLSLQLGFLNYREFFPELYSGASEYDHHEYPQHQLGVQCVASFLFRTDGAIVDFSQCAWCYQ